MAREYSIVIDVPGRILYLLQGSRPYRSYPVAVGKPSTPTPRGTFTIVEKIVNPGEVYGTRLLALSKPYYSIHGTNAPQFIGQAVSNGCVRMHNHHIEEVYDRVEVGTIVRIPGQAEAWHGPGPDTGKGAPGGRVYYVRPGDSLWSIARSNGTTVEELLRLNPGVKSPDLIYPGQRIWLP
ncbi:MAG TPA: L,D-transpeptidase family protein [Firmicutes bacterium]|nr:L,D-transpeptidase family protein [Bacillota bacterium]